MTEELKRNGGRALVALPMKTSDDCLSSSDSIPVGLSGKKIVIKSADMKEDMQKEAVDVAIAAFEKHNIEKDVAENIKKVFDKKHGPTWHCIVGKNFGVTIELFGISATWLRQDHEINLADIQLLRGSYVTHETNHFVYFYLDSKAVLLFKSG